jgi:hypothetical protein
VLNIITLPYYAALPKLGVGQHPYKRWKYRLSDTCRSLRPRNVFAESVSFSGDTMTMQFDDGRTLSVPLAWYPRLMHSSPTQREHFELIGDGEGIHWPELDEDNSVEGLLAGRRSAESDASLARWLENRKK